jgi:hypothetical protein
MSSRHSTPLENDTTASQASTTASGLTMPNAFSRLMAAAPVVQSTVKRDLCTRPTPVYNQYYNPFQVPVDDLHPDYSPYVYGEPLYDVVRLSWLDFQNITQQLAQQRSRVPNGYRMLDMLL